MIQPKQHYREVQHRPLAAKTLRHTLIQFITREFPRLGGPWVIGLFVDKLLQLVDTHTTSRHRLQPGQTLWLAVAADERPGYRKPMAQTRLTPVVLTLACPEDVAALRANEKRSEVLKRALVRVAKEAYAQDGVLSCTDLGLLFYRTPAYVAALIRQHETATGEIVPRRGSVHDLGRTVSHKAIICHKAFQEGKLTPEIARETAHSPEAVDHYILDFARVHFAVVQRGMTAEEAAFAIQRPVSIVQQYIRLIEAFDLDGQRVYDRAGIPMSMCSDTIELPTSGETVPNERREQKPVAG